MDSNSTVNNNFLVIDQGNTLTKLALFVNNNIIWLRSYATFGEPEAKAVLRETSDVKGAIISSVSNAPEKITSLLDSLEWIILDHNTPVPVINKYATPETLGKDRLAAVVSASQMFPGKDILVIDAGTAITYDFINKDKEYIGGSISPGLNLRFKALNTFTVRLPLYEASENDILTGSNTYESILSGVMRGALLEMDGFITEYKNKFNGLITILTGGDASYFDKKLKSNIFASENLVLNGLKLILQYNLEK